MKKINTLLLLAIGIALSMSSCNSFLDKLPDDRAELNSESKITSLLVSAYSETSPASLMEYSSDNIMDNGYQYDNSLSQEEAYKWKAITSEGNEDPKSIWQNMYSAVAAANQALQAIQDMGNPKSLAPQKGEALMCRAWAMFRLSNVFCLAYNPQTADKDLGLPYPTEPETKVSVKYERGTMAELYKKINEDIETALPLIDDNIYSVPKYHFNQKAAYALAARFNLFYMKYDQTIKYANVVLGETTSPSVLRNYTQYLEFGYQDLGNAYVQASEPANLMIQTSYSDAGFTLDGIYNSRYGHSSEILSYETYMAVGPWGSSAKKTFFLYPANLIMGSNQSCYFPNQIGFKEVVNKTTGAGYFFIVEVPFTTDETLLCRAEAYALTKKYDLALTDLNTWTASHCYPNIDVYKPTKITAEGLKSFYDAMPYTAIPVTTKLERTIKKLLTPQGFTVEAGEMENIIQCILHFRRIDQTKTGMRFNDIKRYGISFSHNIDNGEPIIFKPGDLRGALQLPSDVINAGLTENPR